MNTDLTSMPVEALIEIALQIFASNLRLSQDELVKINQITRELKRRVQWMKTGVLHTLVTKSEEVLS